MFSKLSTILPKTISRVGMRRTVDAAVVCLKYLQIAPKIIHEDALSNTQALSFKNSTLTIAVVSPAWAEQVIQQKSHLIAELNKRLGDKFVAKIRTRVVEEL